MRRYERNEVIPSKEVDYNKSSIEAAAKMAELLEVSLDRLVGHTDLEFDKKMIQRIQEVMKMDSKSREHVFAMLDAFIKQTKMQSVLQ